jgi:hypothetical protein
VTTINEDTEPGIGPSTLRRLAASWPRRATVRTDMEHLANPETYHPELPDYPERLLPFAGHPAFLAASPEQRQQVLTLAWLVYNERVIAAEEYVANPTFAKIMHGVYPGADRHDLRQAVQQAHVDEVWHTYMHMMVMERTRQARHVTEEPPYPHTITFRRLLAAQDGLSERWERDLLSLLWTTVSEISVNAYLELLSRDTTVQPMHTLVPRLHARDESAHGSIMVEVIKELYVHMNAAQRGRFVASLPDALNAFVAEDYEVWPVILDFAGIDKGREIIEDSKRAAGSDLLVRDFSGVRRLVRELEISDLVDFDPGTQS